MQEKEHQIPLTVEEQIQNLCSLGLIIEDIEYAKIFLNDVSYFRLIKAYSLGLKPKNDCYYPGITFSQIIQLYKFNCNLRHLLFEMIERVEVNLRCRISNYFSHKYGVLGYENPDFFNNREYHASFLLEISNEINRNNKSPFVLNFRENYKDGMLPMYALIELFSFGMLSKFYKNMKSEDKKKIASSYGISYKYLESWIESISYVRNICAHYGRLYNAKLPKSPKLFKEHTNVTCNYRIFSVILCISLLVPHDEHWSDFTNQLERLINKYPTVEISRLGFPTNWLTYISTTEFITT